MRESEMQAELERLRAENAKLEESFALITEQGPIRLATTLPWE